MRPPVLPCTPHAQRRHRVTPGDPNPPDFWTYHCNTYLHDAGTVVECADCADWHKDEAYGFEHRFHTEIQDAYHALEYDIVPVHWEEAIDGFITTLETLCVRNRSRFKRYEREFWFTLADEGRPWKQWVRHFWYRSRKCSSVPIEN